ncbi:hypothetical protein LIER_24615 [Lithospermum erythrorhizon]|uniref:Uncharacterized protein n=1 Tax=Lithospermum erythrorhizon TaxID=34254 RepID=A0AAV3R4S5_LITER
MEDDDVGGEKSQDEINIEEDSIGEEVAPIVEERDIDSSVAETAKVADVSDPSVNPHVEDTTGKTVEPSDVSNKSTKVGEDVPKADGVDVSYADNVTEDVKTPTVEDMGDKIESSVKDTMHGLKGDSTSGGDVLKPTLDDFVKDIMFEGMDAAIPDVADGGDIPSVTDTNAETAEKEARPVVKSVDDILDADIHEVIPEDDGQKKKSKKRKHKKSDEAGKTSEPKKKLSKEERAAKRACKAEKKAKRVAEKAA